LIAPFSNWHELRRIKCETLFKIIKAVNLDKLNVLGCATKAIGKQNPTVLGQMREQLFANGKNSHRTEMMNKIFDERSGMGRMADGGWYNECQTPSLAQESSGSHKERSPGACQTRERDAETPAKA